MSIYRFFSLTKMALVCFLAISCNKRQNKNLQDETDTLGKRKWARFADFIGVESDYASLDSSVPDYVTNALSQIPTSADPNRYFLNEYGVKASNNTSESFYVKDDDDKLISKKEYAKLSSNERKKYTPWTRHAQITKLIKHDPETSNGVIDTAWQSQCESIIGMKPYTSNVSFDENKYKIDENGVYIDTTNNKEISDIYVLRFRPYKDNQKNYDEDDVRTALVSIPKLGSSDESLPFKKIGFEGFPLVLYSHGGDSGLDFNQIHHTFQSRILKKAVVVAPTFPGEPLCAFSSDSNSRQCIDKDKKDVNSLLPLIGKKDPLRTDSLELLALHNCINKFLARDNYTDVRELNNDYNEIQSCNDENDNCLDGQRVINNPFYDKLSLNLAASDKYGVSTFLVGASRGGGTAYATLGRIGLLLQEIHNEKSKRIPFKGDFLPSYISAASIFYAPSSFVIGEFKLLLQIMVHKDVSQNLERLPMVPKLKVMFNKFYDAKEGSREEYEALKSLFADIARSDMVYLIPYISLAVQNWRTRFSSTPMNDNNNVSSSPGNITLLHSTEDGIIPYTSSLIAYQAFTTINKMIAKGDNPLSNNNIPGFSYSLLTFQPHEEYYTLDHGGVGCPLHDLKKVNKNTGKCFQGLSGVGPYAHGDESFRTSELANILLAEDVDFNPDLKENFDLHSTKFSYTFNDIAERLKKNIRNDKQREGLSEVSIDDSSLLNSIKRVLQYFRGKLVNARSSHKFKVKEDLGAQGSHLHKENKRFSYTPEIKSLHEGHWVRDTYPIKPIDALDMWFETAALSTVIIQDK